MIVPPPCHPRQLISQKLSPLVDTSCHFPSSHPPLAFLTGESGLKATTPRYYWGEAWGERKKADIQVEMGKRATSPHLCTYQEERNVALWVVSCLLGEKYLS